MHPTTLLASVLIATANIVRADWLDAEDVPSQCTSICQPVVDASNRCENQFDDDDDQRNCICSTANSNSIIPDCEVCIRNSSDDEDEIRDLRQDCGLPNPTGSASSTASAQRTTASVTTATSMATVGQSGTTTVSPSVVTVTPTGSSQPPATGSSGGSSGNGAGSNVASMAAAGAVALGAVFVAIF